MRCALILTTYERPDALARALACIAAQTRRPDALLVADDGSGPETAAVIAAYAVRAAHPVRHLHQPHQGFRAGRARNLAIAATDCDYLVLLDGDMLIAPEFLADHVAFARPGHFTQGVRIPLDAAATARQLRTGAALPGPDEPGLDWRRRAYARRQPRLAYLLRHAANTFVAVKSCNQGAWRADLVRVNGFDEAIEGWGSEDKELCARLRNAGVRRQTLVFGAIAFHLDHPPATRGRAAANYARWQQSRVLARVRCEQGLDAHLPGRAETSRAALPAGAHHEPLL